MRRFLPTLFASAVLFAPTSMRAGDVEDLKATFEKAVKALNARDVDGFLANIHPRGLSFYACGPASGKEGREACEQDWQKFFNKSVDATFNADKFEFRVIGSTGIVWGNYKLVVKSKNGPDQSYGGKYTLIYTKQDGKWLVVWQENSPDPVKS